MSAPPSAPALRPIDAILELARWAPSGDNTQPWRFEVLGPDHAVVHGSDTRDHCVYDLDGHPSQISIGALLETAAIAATGHGLRMDAVRRPGLPDTQPTFDLHFRPDAGVRPSDLLSSIPLRSVQRKPLSRRPLSEAEVAGLEASVGPAYRVVWLAGRARLQAAALMFRSAKLRLVMPEAYQVHRDVIEWNAQFSADRVPDRALGVDAATLRLMRFVMSSWARVQFFNRFLAGTWIPRAQMDFLPALACAAHFLIVAQQEPKSLDDFVDGGRAVQRFWLTATHLGLQLQPEVTPLVFARYARRSTAFSADPRMAPRAADIGRQLAAVVGDAAATQGVFMGRVGAGEQPSSRSLRRALVTSPSPR